MTPPLAAVAALTESRHPAAPGSARRSTLDLPLPGAEFAQEVERELARALVLGDEARLDSAWAAARERVTEFALRPAKRLRPWLLVAGHALAGQPVRRGRGLWRFAAGVELLHTFMLVHDDVADRSALRRGGPALHVGLAPFGPGADLAVVAGDHLFARAIELMLESGLSGAARAARYYLGVCRHTAAGQFLDLTLPHRPLADATPFDALAVAHLKTARYSFAAPLACGAILGRGSPPLVQALERAGRLAGLAFQLRDDLLGLAGDPRETGKPTGDLAEGKRTFPLLVAYRRASADERRALEALGPSSSPSEVARAREVVRARGGVEATERAIERATRAAQRALDALDAPATALSTFRAVLGSLARRAA
jgi:geranylgeranyl diphosphate synthase type I